MRKPMTAISKSAPAYAYLVFVVGIGPKNVKVELIRDDGEVWTDPRLWPREDYYFLEGHHAELTKRLRSTYEEHRHQIDEHYRERERAATDFKMEWDKSHSFPAYDPMKIIAEYGQFVEPSRNGDGG